MHTVQRIEVIRIIGWIASLILGLALAGCVALAPENATVTVTVTPLTLDGQDDTFLARIDAARAELGDTVSQRFVETGDAAGGRWQGEALITPDQTVLFLQRAQSGGDSAVRIDAAAGADVAAILAAARATEPLSTVAASATVPPADVPPADVTIQFVRARQSAAGVWAFDVTLHHPDVGWADYVDGWQVETLDGTILGTRILLHPHVDEMPFTRSLSGVRIPADVTVVRIRSHDLISGYDPDTVHVPIAKSGSDAQYEVIR